QRVRERAPEPPSRSNRRVDRDLETICLTCLEKDPRRRYPSADAVASDLGRYLAGEPIQARRTGPLERAAKWARRRPAIAALLAAVVLVAVAGFGGVLWQLRQTEAARRVITGKAADLDRNLYYKLIDLAHRDWSTRNLAHFEETLAACPPHLRGWEWDYLRHL